MNDDCASHRFIKLDDGEATETICECGKWTRVTYKGARLAEEGEDNEQE